MREGDVTLNESVHFILLAMVRRPHTHYVVYKFEMNKMGSVSATQKQQFGLNSTREEDSDDTENRCDGDTRY